MKLIERSFSVTYLTLPEPKSYIFMRNFLLLVKSDFMLDFHLSPSRFNYINRNEMFTDTQKKTKKKTEHSCFFEKNKNICTLQFEVHRC